MAYYARCRPCDQADGGPPRPGYPACDGTGVVRFEVASDAVAAGVVAAYERRPEGDVLRELYAERALFPDRPAGPLDPVG